MTISAEAGRVLGCLVEKQLTTPQQYPLTVNALALACSQASNREPSMTMGEGDVRRALDELKAQRLVRFVLPSHGKSVTRFRHVLDEAYGLDRSRSALLSVLLLRGPQTSGELRARTARTAELAAVGDVQDELRVLAGQPEPLVELLGRRPGQKEERWQQLLAAEWDGAGEGTEPGPPAPARAVDDDGEATGEGATGPEAALGRLRYEVSVLRDEVAELRSSLEALRSSLGG